MTVKINPVIYIFIGVDTDRGDIMLVRLYTLTPEKVLDIKSSLSWIKGTTGLIADNNDERYKQVIQALD